MARFIVAVLSLFLATSCTTCDAFQPSRPFVVNVPNALGYKPSSSSSSSSCLSAIGPEHSQLIQDGLNAIPELPHALHTASTMLADAAEAVAETANDDGGWWQSYLNIFESGLKLVHNTVDGPLRSAGITQTWGISIALFTAGVRSLLVPLSVQQSKSAEYMKALKPKMVEIREKFKDNKDTQNRAIAKLYEDANQNPLSGCLLSLAQLPIFLGLYRGVRLLAQDGQLQEPFLWIPSLEGPVTAPDFRGLDWLIQGWDFSGGGLPTPSLGWETTLAFLIMPVILVLGQSLTMSVLSPPVDDSLGEEEKEQFEKTQRILKFLPLLIGFFSLQVPAGLTIYWFTSNGFTLLQSLAVRSYYAANPPQVELPDYWDALDDVAKMSPEERRKAAEAGLSVGPSFKELMEEAKFHVTVERDALREQSASWQRISSSSDSSAIPSELQSWVSAVSTTTASTESPASKPNNEPALEAAS